MIDSPELLRQHQERSHNAAQLLRDQGFYQHLAEALEAVRIATPDYASAADVPTPPFLADPLGVNTHLATPTLTGRT